MQMVVSDFCHTNSQPLSIQQQFPLTGLLILALLLLPGLGEDEFRICTWEGKGHSSVHYQSSCQALQAELKRHSIRLNVSFKSSV